MINVLTGQDTAIVSDTPGTTTDPVKKSIEINGMGPVIITDTAGIDDSGNLGKERVKKTEQVIKLIDLAIILILNNKIDDYEVQLFNKLYDYGVPCIFIHNKSDIERLNNKTSKRIENEFNSRIVDFCTIKPENSNQLVNLIQV